MPMTRDTAAGMVHALGFSFSEFDPNDPGRLCRGRERWIDAFNRPDIEPLFRVSVSGAAFSDDSARDAHRGLQYSGLTCGRVIHALFPDAELIAWAEGAHPRTIPDEAEGVEMVERMLPRGPLRRWESRWTLFCASEEEVDEAIDAGASVILVMANPPPEEAAQVASTLPPLADAHLDPTSEGGLPEDMRKALHYLTGHRVEGIPARLFQAVALPDVLEFCEAVILIHRDKHGPCLGIYASDEIDAFEVLGSLASDVAALSVPFAIPPMLARWDRALWELRQDWDEVRDGEYPVPPAEDGVGGWGRRGPRRRRRGYDDEE